MTMAGNIDMIFRVDKVAPMKSREKMCPREISGLAHHLVAVTNSASEVAGDTHLDGKR